MKYLLTTTLLLLLLNQTLFAQESLLLNGKVIVDLESLSGIDVENKTKKYQKVTSNGGYFSLRVSLSDTLVFTHPSIQTFVHIVKTSDFETDLLKLKLTTYNIKLLDELKINKIDVVALGILQKPAKQYTPLERKLRRASGGYEKITIGNMMTFPIDPILNAINGRTKELKKAVDLERIFKTEQDILKMFEQDFLIKTFNITEDQISLFLNYAAYDPEVKNAVATKDKDFTFFVLSKMANNFHKIQNE